MNIKRLPPETLPGIPPYKDPGGFEVWRVRQLVREPVSEALGGVAASIWRQGAQAWVSRG